VSDALELTRLAACDSWTKVQVRGAAKFGLRVGLAAPGLAVLRASMAFLPACSSTGRARWHSLWWIYGRSGVEGAEPLGGTRADPPDEGWRTAPPANV